MTQYTDIKGKIVNVGDILKYDENNNGRFSTAIHEVVEYKNILSGVPRIGYPFWTITVNHRPTPLRCYCITPNTVLIDAEVIGNVNTNPEMLTVEYAAKIFPLVVTEKK